MRISDNERIILETIRDGVYTTGLQVANACGFPYSMTRHLMINLFMGGLIEPGYSLTYAGYKVLDGEDLKSSDNYHNVDLRVSEVRPHHLED